ncbi:ribosomal protein S3AE [Pseudomonas alcaligenes]|uniref:Ribosomal protein S3AE n=1 Tax=Aquipseudomonas alcaligenes TaxID=43263 RepID=A0ABR7S5U1_AQUAC|nr:hypothetical protein [Pseudomonas alcaligenes]MBC9252940.1 ribosomal protein S3AE [Pseudomonas alcaligenes]
MTAAFPLRKECPPGLCICERERLLEQAGADLRILQLTLQEEKRLLERLENLADLADLQRMQLRMFQQLGISLQITPSLNEVRTMRGISIVVEAQPGLCRKTRQAIPTAIRRSLERHPEIAYAILNANDLLRDA